MDARRRSSCIGLSCGRARRWRRLRSCSCIASLNFSHITSYLLNSRRNRRPHRCSRPSTLNLYSTSSVGTPPLSPSQVCLPSPLPPLQPSLCNPSPLPSPPCPLCARTLFLPHASRQHRSASPPPTACFAAKPCLHAAVLASPLDIRERLRPEQHSPCSCTCGACDGRRPSRRRSCRSAFGDCAC